jgi:hypothetical protein
MVYSNFSDSQTPDDCCGFSVLAGKPNGPSTVHPCTHAPHTIRTIHHTPYAPYTTHHAPHTPHHAPHTPHHAPHTPHHAPHTMHHAPHTIHHAPCTMLTMYHTLFWQASQTGHRRMSRRPLMRSLSSSHTTTPQVRHAYEATLTLLLYSNADILTLIHYPLLYSYAAIQTDRTTPPSKVTPSPSFSTRSSRGTAMRSRGRTGRKTKARACGWSTRARVRATSQQLLRP